MDNAPGRRFASDLRTRVLPLATLTLIACGAVLQLAGAPSAGDAVWAATVAVMLVPLTVSIAKALAAGRVGVDAIALIAMAGALAVGQYLAGAVIALMLSGGNALEAMASRRAPQRVRLGRGPDRGAGRGRRRACARRRAGSG